MITRQLLRYATVGIVHNLSGYLLYLLVTSWGAEPKRTMSVLFVLGVAVSFALNRSWTFAHSGPVVHRLWRYFAIYLLGYAFNFVALWFFHDRLGYAHQWVQGIAALFIAAFSFLMIRYFVFSASSTARNT